jgi:hypothetical protein
MKTKPDLFAEFESISEILAFIFHREGVEALQQLLDQITEIVDFETLIDAADGLDAAGLPDGAAIIRKSCQPIGDKSASAMTAS